MNMDNNWCVYMHTNKINGKKYIGITSISVDERWGKHGHRYSKQLFGKAVKKYGWDGFYHAVIYDNLSFSDAINKEKELISEYKTTDRKYGYNITPGGDASAYKMNSKCVYQYTLDGNFIRKYDSISDAERKVGKGVSSCINGYARTAYNFQWFDNYKGLKTNPVLNRVEAISVSQHKKVFQYSINGDYIQCFDSIKDASTVTGIERTGIGNCMNEKCKYYKGYIWKPKYCGKHIPSVKEYYNKPKSVFQYSIDGEYIKEFKSRHEVFQQLGFRIRTINKTNISNGFRWFNDYMGEILPKELLTNPTDKRGYNYRSSNVKKIA